MIERVWHRGRERKRRIFGQDLVEDRRKSPKSQLSLRTMSTHQDCWSKDDRHEDPKVLKLEGLYS